MEPSPWTSKLAPGEKTWANMANENNAMGPPSKPVSYKAKTYLPEADKWVKRQGTIEEEASSERANTPTPLRESNLENLGINKYSYNRNRERKGLRPRPNRTPSRERRRRTYRRSPSPVRRQRGFSPRRVPLQSRRRSPSPRTWRRAPSPRRRSPSPRTWRRAPSPRRRSPSPRTWRRAPSPRRRSPSPRRRGSPPRSGTRRASPLRYTVAENGRMVDEFGRNIPTTRRRPSGY